MSLRRPFYGEGSSGRNGTSLQVPPRWMRCPRRGNLIADKFIPFKTPLDDKYQDQIEPQCLFTPPMFISSVNSYLNSVKKGMTIGLWIDLTFTKRFYDQEVVEKLGIKYVKLQCRGHQETPDREQTETFKKIVVNFINANPNQAIGVHCTHGFNRTGFLISAYLVEQEDWGIDAAVGAFAASRPPGIYKEDYLRELFSRYGDIDDCPPPPQKPDWCIEDQDEFDDEGNSINALEREINGSLARGPPAKKEVFMEGASGLEPVTDTATCREVYNKVTEFCSKLGWRKKGFPGSQPVSMTMENLGFLQRKPYKVSWKADGTRALVLIDGPDRVFFVDRDFCIFQVKGVRFFQRKAPQEHIKDTLVDGEMVIDEVSGEKIVRFLIYDIIMFMNQLVGGMDFNIRLLCIEKELIMPRDLAKKEGRIDRQKEPFGIRKKDFWDVSTARHILEKFSKDFSHEIDGLIFQPVPDPYMPDRCDQVLKWKPPTHNSVDFRLKIQKEQKLGMLPQTIGYLYVGGANMPFDSMAVTKDMRVLDGKIIECTYDVTARKWKFMRERTDKSFPNSYNTAIGVCESIKHPVTKDILLDFIERAAWRPHPGQFHPSGQHPPAPHHPHPPASNNSPQAAHMEKRPPSSDADGDLMPPPHNGPVHKKPRTS